MFIGEPRLSDFKQVLTKSGIQAEFSGGALICNNMVAVKKVSVFVIMAGLYFRDYFTRKQQHKQEFLVLENIASSPPPPLSFHGENCSCNKKSSKE